MCSMLALRAVLAPRICTTAEAKGDLTNDLAVCQFDFDGKASLN